MFKWDHTSGSPTSSLIVGFATLTWCASVALAAPQATESEQAAKEAGLPISEADSPEAAELFAKAGELQNAGKLEDARRAWSEFLKKHDDDPLVIDAHHYLGICLLQKQQYASAVKHLVQVVDQSKDARLQEEALVSLAWCHYSLGATTELDPDNLKRAAKYFTRHTKEYPASPTVDDSLFYIGECMNLLGHHDKAQTAYEVLINDHPQSAHCADALVSAAYVATASQQFQRAAAYLERVTNDFPERAKQTDAQLAYADALVGMRRFAEAERIFAQLAKNEELTTLEYVLFRQANSLEQLERHKSAAAAFDKIVQRFPKSEMVGTAGLGAGRNYSLAGELGDAERALLRALEHDGSHVPAAHHWMAQVMLRRHQPGPAAEWAEKTLAMQAIEPLQRLQAELDRAEAQAQSNGSPQDVFTRFDAMLQETSLDDATLASDRKAFIVRTAVRTAIALNSANHLSKYGGLLISDLGDDPAAAGIERLIVDYQLAEGAFADAADRLEGMITRYPNHDESEIWQLQLAASRYRTGDFSGAAAVARKLVIGPALRFVDPSEPFCILGAAELKLGNLESAVGAFEKGLSAAPRPDVRGKMLLQLAEAHQQLGDEPAATQALRQLLDDKRLSIQPAIEQPIKLALAGLAGIQGDRETAEQMYAELRPHTPVTTEAELERGWLAVRNGDFAAAEADFSKLITTAQEGQRLADACYGRALARKRLGNNNGALEDLEAFFDQDGSRFTEEALLLQAECQLSESAWSNAIVTLTRLSEQFPATTSKDKALSHLVVALSRLGKLDEATRVAARLSDEFPESRWLAQAWRQLADAEFENQRFDEAAKAYLHAASASEVEAAVESATYRRGWALFQSQQFALATTVFENQRAEFPQGPLADRAHFMQAEALFKMGQFESALKHYQALRSTSRLKTELAVLTLLHGSECLRRARQYEQSAEWLGDIVRDHPNSVYAAKSHYELAQTNVQLKRNQKAVQHFKAAASTGSPEISARAHYGLGQIHLSAQEFSQAKSEFSQLMQPLERIAETATLARLAPWRARAGLEAARCCEQLARRQPIRSRRALVREKKNALQFVLKNFPDTEEAKIAERELQRLRLALESEPEVETIGR